MSDRCEICGKSRLVGNRVSHSHVRTKRVQRPNTQKVRALIEGRVVRVRVCTRCIRTGAVKKST